MTRGCKLAGLGIHRKGRLEDFPKARLEARERRRLIAHGRLQAGADGARRLAYQEPGQKAGVGRHRVRHEGAGHAGLHHQVHGEPAPVEREAALARPRAADGVSLPKVVERGQGLLPVLGLHGEAAEKLPAFVREEPERRHPLGEFPGQPLEGRFRHRAVGRWRRGRLAAQRVKVRLGGDALLALALPRLGEDAVAVALP